MTNAEYRANLSDAGERNTVRMSGVSAAKDGRPSAPIEVPEDILERVSTLCLALPEVTVRVDASLISGSYGQPRDQPTLASQP